MLLAAALAMGVAASGATRPASSVQGRWVIRDLGTLGRSFISSEAVDINDRGQIVGGSGTGSLGRAFIWEAGTMTPLGTLGGLESSARAINNAGVR